MLTTHMVLLPTSHEKANMKLEAESLEPAAPEHC